ncbi:MAG TPA: sugar ABC transporter permease [Halanaerobiales bacterium]|nr:sugar ABC transporter permease [Halanaerobiales bacterium]
MKKYKSIAYLFILPAVLAMIFVHILPMIWGIMISFRDLNLYTIGDWTQARFVGFDNYIKAFQDATIASRYWLSVKNIVFFSAVTIIIGTIIALGVALLLNRKFPGRTLIRGIILVPFITPDSVVFNFWRFIFQNRIGILNEMLLRMGAIGERVMWLVGDNAMWSVIIAAIWKGWPFGALVFLAGLQTIPDNLYDAAKIDGASHWQCFRYITWAYIRPVLATLTMMNILWNFNAYNQFRVLFGEIQSRGTEVPATLIMTQAFSHFKYGLGSALSVIWMLVLLSITILYLYFFRKRSEE